MTEDAGLTVIELSESFHALWSDIAEELHVTLSIIDEPNPGQLRDGAVLIAAGGEEDRGLDLLSTIEPSAERPMFLIGSRTAHRFGIEAVRRGASDYFALPDDLDLLRRSLAAQFEVARERRSGAVPRTRVGFDSIVGESGALRATLEKASRIMQHGDLTVMIGGDTGTGKEVLARALHDEGPRADGPFVAINCAAIPASLLESELFGHEKGAFTDAHHARTGLFEEANRGTLFLDEIGHLPLQLQGKLLRALEEKVIRRVGGSEDRPFDARIITATHLHLPDAIDRGEFRQDLFYRLNVVSLHLPPLRDRDDDLELLTREFARLLAERYGLPTPEITPALLTALRNHDWPGNVRELRHAIERTLLLSPPGTLDPSELGLQPDDPRAAPSPAARLPFPATLRDITRAAAKATIELHDGNKSAAARHLGISRARLQRLVDTDGDEES